MARTDLYTWLPLNRFAEILGIDPLHFEGAVSEDEGMRTECGDVWLQFAWQNANAVSREDVAMIIRDAEVIIANYVGYNLLPDWVLDEVELTVRPSDRGLYSLQGVKPRWTYKSTNLHKGHVISGGIKANEIIEAGAAVARSNPDGDGYDELMTVTVSATTPSGVVITDPDEIRAYYPGESGEDIWEIRPINVSISAGVVTITFNSWQLFDPELQLGFRTTVSAYVIDADAAASYLTTVDVYRVFNDPQTQATLQWQPSPANTATGLTTNPMAAWSEQTGVLQVKNNRLGIATYAPATWDVATEQFNFEPLAEGREPDKLRLQYYSGFQNKNYSRPLNVMDYYWEIAVVRLALALLDRHLCGCQNLHRQVTHWQMDKAAATPGFNITPAQADNPFGSQMGALYAFSRCKQEGRRLGR